MANTLLSAITASADNADANTKLLGVAFGIPNQDLLFSIPQIAGGMRKMILVTVGNSPDERHLTDPFFSNTISVIFAGNSVYIAGNDFTQAATTIQSTNNIFITGQQVIAII
jgi:hypothetical protein